MEKETSKRKKNSPSNARLTGAPLAHKIAKLKFQRCIHILLSSFRASSCTNGNDNGIIEIIGRGAGSGMVNTVNTVTRAERGARGGRKENRTKFRKTLSYPQKPCRPAFCSPVIGPPSLCHPPVSGGRGPFQVSNSASHPRRYLFLPPLFFQVSKFEGEGIFLNFVVVREAVFLFLLDIKDRVIFIKIDRNISFINI